MRCSDVDMVGMLRLRYSSQLGSDFEPGVEYTVVVNTDTVIKFVAQ